MSANIKGKLETRDTLVTWDSNGFTIHRAPGVIVAPVTSKQAIVQMSWWEHEVKLGMLGRMMGKKSLLEAFVHAELRLDGKHLASFRAVVKDRAALAGLPHRRSNGGLAIVSYDKLAVLTEAASELGAELVNPMPETAAAPELVAMPEEGDDIVDLVEGASLLDLVISGARAIRVPAGTFELDAVEVNGELLIVGAGQNATTIISTANQKWGFSVRGLLALRDLTIKDADTPNKGLVLITDEGHAVMHRCSLRGDPDDTGAKGIVVEQYGQLYLKTSMLTGVYFALTVKGASQAVLVDTRFEKSFAGIRISENAEAKVLGCVCFDNTTGLAIKGNAAAIIDGNSLLFNVNAGLEISGEAQCAVFRNLCEGNNRGIFVRSSLPFPMEGNQCINNSNVGIQLQSANPLVVSGNICRWNQHGIEVNSPDSTARIERNVCNDNLLTGIHICVGAPVTASGNTCKRNDKGIQVDHVIGGGDGTGPTLEDNIIEDNRAEGILFEGGGSARRNSMVRNSVSIRVSTVNKVILEENSE